MMRFKDYVKKVRDLPVTEVACVQMQVSPFASHAAPSYITSIKEKGIPVIKLPGCIVSDGRLSTVRTFQEDLFQGNEEITDIILNHYLDEFPKDAFWGCRNLQRITIPKGIRIIHEGTFWDCTALTDIYYEGTPEEWARMEKNFEKHTVIYGGLIPGSPVEQIEEELIERTPGNEALYTATVHFRCPLGYENGSPYERPAKEGEPVKRIRNICTMCGRVFTDCEGHPGFSFGDIPAFGSGYDGKRIRIRLCGECFDRMLSWMRPQCGSDPVTDGDPLP